MQATSPPGRAFLVDDRGHVFEGERLEVEPVDRVVVGRHRLRIAVDHHGLEPLVLQGERRVATAVVELDALSDTVGSRAENHHLAAVRRGRLALPLPGSVEIGGERLELRRTGVDALVDGGEARVAAPLAHDGRRRVERAAQLFVAEPGALEVGEEVGGQGLQPGEAGRAPHLDDLGELGQEPPIDASELVHLLDGPPPVESLEHREHPAIRRHHELPLERGVIGVLLVGVLLVGFGLAGEQPAALPDLQRADSLEKRLLERTADGHRLSDRLHLGHQGAVGLRELLEGPPRHLDDDVVERGLEAGRGQAGDVVGDLFQTVAEGQLRRDLRDRKPGRLGGQGGRARHPRIHLDGHHPAVVRVHRELDVGAAGLDPDTADDPPGRIAHPLVFLVGEGQRRRHGDAVAGVHAHRVDVLDRAHHDEVVGGVAHHLELELLPADDRFLDEDLVHRTQLDAPRHDVTELLDVVGDASADPAQGERRPHDRGKAEAVHHAHRLVERLGVGAGRYVDADGLHRLAELQAVFGHHDGVDRGPDQRYPELLEHPVGIELHRQVQRGLAPDRRQQRIGTFPGDYRAHHFPGQRLDVGPIRDLRVRHDGRGVRVDQDHLDALGPERLARLGARIVELARLADHDRAGADDEHAFDVSTAGHGQQGSDGAARHLLQKSGKQIVGVVGARRGLRMVLHAEDRLPAMTQPLDGAVVEIQVGHLDVVGE